MAVTTHTVNDALTVKLWRRKLFREMFKPTDIGRFFGAGSNALIQVVDDTKKESGDRIRIGLRMLLSGAGISDGTLEGNEEALTLYTDDILIKQLRHAVRTGGTMSEQRVMYSMREEMRMGLTDWWRDRLAVSFFNQAGSNLNESDVRFTGMQSAATADTAHNYIAGTGFTGGANTAALLSDTVSDKMQLTLLDDIVAQAKTLTPAVRPVMLDGVGEVYVAFIHPFMTKDLRTTTGTGTWQDIQKAAMMGGQITKNPIFTGALGMYNKVILHEDSRVPLMSDNSGTAVANTRAGIFCGAQSAVFAMGKGFDAPKGSMQTKMSWEEETFDYSDQYGVAAGMIWGLKKSVFNNADFSVIRFGTYAAAP